MSYIGNGLTTQSFTGGMDSFNGNASNTVFGLSRTLNTAYDVDVYVENVWQRPGVGYSVSANTITFSSAPSSGSNNVVVVYRNFTATTLQPADGSVSTRNLGTITNINAGTDASITLQANNATALTVGANTTVVAAGKVDAAQYNANSVLGYRFGDANTGMMAIAPNGSNGLYLRTSGNNAVTVAANGFVGVGTSSPNATLAVSGTANISGVATFSNNVTVVGNTTLSRASSIYVPHTGTTGGYGNTAIGELRFGSYGRLQHTTFSNVPIITFNAQLYDSDFTGSGSGGGDSNKIRPDYNLGTYSIISSVNGGVAFNAGNWSSNNSIDISYIENHSSYSGGVDNYGRWRKPKQPAFSATTFGASQGNISNSTVVVQFPQATYNIGSCYSTSTYRFTAPVAGIYLFSFQLLLQNVDGSDGDIHTPLYVNGSMVKYIGARFTANAGAYYGYGGYVPVSGIAQLQLAANDYVDLRIFGNSSSSFTIYSDAVWSHFSGYLLG